MFSDASTSSSCESVAPRCGPDAIALNGEWLSMSDVARLFPSRRAGKRLSVQTVWRWCTRGVRLGIRLRSALVGGHRCTTLQWVNEFIESVSQASRPQQADVPRTRTAKQRQTASERATEDLKAAWRRRQP